MEKVGSKYDKVKGLSTCVAKEIQLEHLLKPSNFFQLLRMGL